MNLRSDAVGRAINQGQRQIDLGGRLLGQIQAHPRGLGGLVPILTGKAGFKDAGQITGRHPGALVNNLQGRSLPSKGDHPARRGVFNRIGHQLGHNKGQPLAVT